MTTTRSDSVPNGPEQVPDTTGVRDSPTPPRTGFTDSFLTVMLGQYAVMQAVIATTGVVRNKVVALRLGPFEFGEITQLIAVVAVVATLVEFGMRVSVSRNVAKTQDRDERQALLANANGLVLGLAALAIAGMTAALTSGNLLELVGISPTTDTMIATAIFIASIPFLGLQTNYLAFLQGVLDIKGVAMQRSIGVILATVATVPLVWFMGLVGAAASFLILNVLLSVLLGRRGHALGYRVLAVRLNGDRLRLLASFGLVSVIAGFAGVFADTSVRAALIDQVGAAANGLLQAPLVVATTLQTVLLGSIGTMALTTVATAKGQEETSRTVRQLVSVVLPLAIMALGLLGLLGVPAMVILYSQEFVSGATYLPFILVYEVLLVLVWITGSPMLAAGDRMIWLVQDLIWVAMGWVISMVLLPALGATAVVVGMLAGATGQLVMQTMISLLRYRVTIGYRHAVHAALGVALVAVLAEMGASPTTPLAILAFGSIAWCGYAIYCLRVTPVVAIVRTRLGR